MIYIKAIRELIEPINSKMKRPFFKLKFVKMSTGEIVSGEVVCTSSSWHNNTINIRFRNSKQIRTIHIEQMIEFNGQEVMI